ncbi:MAG: hypothetical protein ABI873_16170 [Marmoricola sp.]
MENTGGQLSTQQRRALLGPMARAHARGVTGRMLRLVWLNPGRRVHIAPGRLDPPSSALTRAAALEAGRRLSPAMLNHSYRAYTFGAALGSITDLEIDYEVLFAAALLHNTGLPSHIGDVDFTLSSARVARDVAETAGLSTAATRILRTAITLHTNPDVTLDHGPVAHLLAAGVALDVTGARCGELPQEVLAATAARYPRLGFKQQLRAALLSEALRVPHGRIQFLRRHGYDLAIRLAPFRG